MNIRVKHIPVGELTAYTGSEDYIKQSFEAISIYRALSHARNPRGRPDDVALLLAYDEDKLAGYLGAIPETLYSGGKEHRVCWYSCMWVLPEYRRSGIAKMLLEEGSRHYGNRVLITNYIPASKAAFLKKDQFSEIVVLQGVRAYLRFDLQRILPHRKPALRWIRPMLRLSDGIGNLITGAWFRMRIKEPQDHTVREIDEISGEMSAFIGNNMLSSPFRRGKEEFHWLRQYPWVKTQAPEGTDTSRYYFSQESADFRQWMLEIRNGEGRIAGFALLTRHRKELKTHYILGREDIMPDLFRHVYRLMLKENVSTLVCHSESLVREIERRRGHFLLIRPSEYGFMATPEILHLLGDRDYRFHEGDGDGMFT